MSELERARVNISQERAIKQTNRETGMNEEQQMKINEGVWLVWGEGEKGGGWGQGREGLKVRLEGDGGKNSEGEEGCEERRMLF